MANNCNQCSHRILSHSKVMTCKLCLCNYHLQCIPGVCETDSIYINSMANSWFCVKCTEDIFPLNRLDDDSFKETLMKSFHCSPILSLQQLSQLQFNVFELNNDQSIFPLSNVDPDIQYFNNAVCFDNLSKCNYYLEDEFNKTTLDMNINNNCLSLIHLNIRSISANLYSFKNYLSLLDFQFKIIGITETWLNDNNAPLFGLPQYNHEYLHRQNRKGGGVSLFIQKNLPFRKRDELCKTDNVIESLFIEISKFTMNSKKDYIIGVIYRPPGTDLNLFNDRITDIFNTIKTENKLVYIMGDFNVNLLNVDSHILTSEFIELMYSNCLFPLINKPTRICQSSATLIDNIFTNNIYDDNVLNGLLFTDISDHLPIFSINTHSLVESKQSYCTRKYSQNNSLKFSTALQNCDWNDVLLNNNGLESFNLFYNKFSNLYNECFPIETIKMGYGYRKSWLSEGLKKSIRIKNKLYVKAIKSKNDSLLTEYKHYKSQLNKLVRIMEKNYYNEELNRNKGNLRKLWVIVKNVINKKGHSCTQSTFKCGEGLISDKNNIAKYFNNYFSNVGRELEKKINITNDDPVKYITKNNNSIYLNPANTDELRKIIINLKETSEGWDGINAKLIKQTYHLFIEPLCNVINLSLSQGVFPDQLKKARVVPIFKSGDNMLFTNYRPVSVLPIFSKILERVIHNRFISFIDRHNILYKYQFGFRNQHSTNSALIVLIDKIIGAIDKNEVVIGLFLDFQKAFDTVNHEILLRKLDKYGIRGVALKWVKDYLFERKQFVNFNGVNSDCNIVKCGVPQGSILGPLLFLLYINDISNVSKILFPIIFADDTNMFIKGKSLNELVPKMNNELTKIVHWLKCNRLSLNINKTHYMIFHSSKRKIQNNLPITIDNNEINCVQKSKFIGVILEPTLTWSNHIQWVRQKVARGIGVLLKARKVFKQDTLITLYNSLILPYFVYCNEVWGNAAQKYLHPLFKLQKKCVRIIRSASFLEHTNPIFRELKILPLAQIYKQRIVLLAFKFIKGNLPNLFKDIFMINEQNRTTRQKYLLQVAVPKTEFYRKTVRFTAVYEWNLVLGKLDHFCSIHTFKKRLRTTLLDELLNH